MVFSAIYQPAECLGRASGYCNADEVAVDLKIVASRGIRKKGKKVDEKCNIWPAWRGIMDNALMGDEVIFCGFS